MARTTRMAERIKRLREERGWSQQELAVRVGVALSQVSRWERGLGEPYASTCRSLAKVFEVSLDELIGKQ